MSLHLRAFSALTGAAMVTMVTQIIRGKMLAVILAPAGIGVLNQLQSTTNLLTTVSGLGFFSGVTQRVAVAKAAGDDAAISRQMSSATIFLVGFSLLLTLAAVIWSPVLSNLMFADGGARADFVILTALGIPLTVAAQVYRALLSGLREVAALVRVRIVGDLLGLAVLAGLLIPLGLRGAVIAFVVTQAVTLSVNLWQIVRVLGVKIVSVRFRDFDLTEVRANLGYGAVSLFAVVLASLSVIIPSRWIIEFLGAEDNGLFVTAMRITAIYMGAINAASHSYFFPTLAAAKDANDTSLETNGVLQLYMILLPPLMAGIITFADVIIPILFSNAFLPVALLLCILLPADLFTNMFRTLSLGLWARKHLWDSFAMNLWVPVYLVLGWFLLHAWGIVGLAWAYLGSQLFALMMAWVLIRLRFGFRFTGSGALASLLGVALVGGVGWTAASLGHGWTGRGVAIALVAVWGAAIMANRELRTPLLGFLHQMLKRVGLGGR